MAQWFLALTLLLLSVIGVRTQAPPPPTKTMTNKPQHPFCHTPPYPQAPKMEIFQMDIRTGFLNGYRSNQTVIVELTAKFPDVWRIQQVFIHVPDNDPYVHRGRGNDYRYHKTVGHWAWNLMQGNSNPDVGGTQPVDCGGISNYGPFGMLSSMGAHAAMEITAPEDPNNPRKGWVTVTAKWVPPSNWENIIYRKMITIQAFVTFEKTPPGTSPAPQVNFRGGYTPPQNPARWIKKDATLLNLDYIDIHNYILTVYRPWYDTIYGTKKLIVPVVDT
ncbi:uncharacterized protein [Littorina saxatilis]|uniref:Uncharacterized protein n=1 Tax=Littorina saxatilis TaxID=31220 RepID=A0AAN9AXL1_9CAEN